MNESSQTRVQSVVLVHGGFVDGSGWQGVYYLLKKNGYTVSIVQNPTLSLATTSRSPSAHRPRRTARRSWSAIPTEVL